jgi:hypothetical protein
MIQHYLNVFINLIFMKKKVINLIVYLFIIWAIISSMLGLSTDIYNFGYEVLISLLFGATTSLIITSLLYAIHLDFLEKYGVIKIGKIKISIPFAILVFILKLLLF